MRTATISFATHDSIHRAFACFGVVNFGHVTIRHCEVTVTHRALPYYDMAFVHSQNVNQTPHPKSTAIPRMYCVLRKESEVVAHRNSIRSDICGRKIRRIPFKEFSWRSASTRYGVVQKYPNYTDDHYPQATYSIV